MHTDSMFVIGNDHLKAGLPCQDYAISGVDLNGAAYAIVSDGCSSGRRTDMGARITATTMEHALRANVGSQTWLHQRTCMLASWKATGSDFTDLYATCVYAFCSAEERYVHVRGDGGVAWTYPDGRIQMASFDWGNPGENNPPYYPAYSLGNLDLEAFKLHYAATAAEAVNAVHYEVTDEGPMLLEAACYSLEEGIEGIRLPIPDEAVAVAVFTDGIMRVPGLQWHEVVQQLLAFKSAKGQFVKRRMLRFLAERTTPSTRPADDLAYAVINLEGGS